MIIYPHGRHEKKCLDVYMTEYLDVFRSGRVGVPVNPDNLIRCVNHNYEFLYAPWIHDGTPKRSGCMRERKCGNFHCKKQHVS